MTQKTEHDILTIEEVAEYLRVSERTVYDWANKGEIPCGKLGTTWRFKRSEIEKWVDERLTGRRSTPAPPAPGVGHVLAPERVLFLNTDSKNEALKAVAAGLATAPEVTDEDELTREIFHREELMSTGIGFSVAVPHVRLKSVTGLAMAVGIGRKDITDYESLDEKPVRIICMLAARSDQHAQYLKTLGAISALLKNEGIREALLTAPDAETAYAILTQ